MQALQLKRGLFGYTPESVRLLLADRDKMFIRAAEQARAAEALVLELRSEVEALKAQFEERQEALRAAEAEAADLRTDRDATRVELDRVAATVTQLTADVEAASKELADAEELVRVADAQVARQNGDLAVMRQELGTARRDFLTQNQRARSAENRVEELAAELVSTRDRLEAELRWSTEELSVARAVAAEAAAAQPQELPTPAQELSAVVEATELTLARVLDSARVRAEAELREAERARREIREDVERLAAWRERLAPLVRAVRASIDETQLRAVQVGDGVRDAVDPVTEALQALSDRLAVLAELAGPPAAPDGDAERALRVIQLNELNELNDEAPAGDRGTTAKWGWR
jgi:predicted  nucleic acid-binding Zn-ribbon protein